MKHFPYNARLPLLAIIMLLLWLIGSLHARAEGNRLWGMVRNGQSVLWEKQEEMGLDLSQNEDWLKTGFIGVEWSPMTTTLGSLEAKRTSANPLWALRFTEWFDELGLKRGDKVAVFSSASFPGMLFSALAAAEERGLEVLLSVSLGASMWGANREEFPWPLMETTLREGGFIKTHAAFYTPGGAAEVGREFTPETMSLLHRLSEETETPLVVGETLDDVIKYKSQRLHEFKPKLLISIGGSNANLGDSADASEIPNGLLLPGGHSASPIGDGLIGDALRAEVPVLNVLNLRGLAEEAGIPWDARVFTKIRPKPRVWVAFAGLAVFFAFLFTHKRWTWPE